MHVYACTCVYMYVYACIIAYVCVCMCLCVCICMCVYVDVHLCMHIYVYVYLCKYMYAYLCVLMRMYLCVLACICMYVYVCVRMCMFVCEYVGICKYTYVYVCFCMYMYVHGCVYMFMNVFSHWSQYSGLLGICNAWRSRNIGLMFKRVNNVVEPLGCIVTRFLLCHSGTVSWHSSFGHSLGHVPLHNPVPEISPGQFPMGISLPNCSVVGRHEGRLWSGFGLVFTTL